MSHKKNSKRQQQISEIISGVAGKKLALDEAVQIIKQCPKAKFDQAIEIAVQLGIDTKQADQQVRGSTIIPFGTGKKTRVAVIANATQAKAAKEAGADLVGEEDLIAQIMKGDINFDKLLVTPDQMKELGKLGRILGPKGLMPNPKDGTVTNNMGQAVEDIKKGRQVNFRAEKDGAVVHVTVGRVSFSDADIVANVREILQTLNKVKPSTSKGTYIKSAYIKSTMGGAVEIDTTKALSSVA